jgi:ATP-dependent Lon protease
VMQRVRWTLEYFNKDITEEYPNLSEAFQSKCAMLTVIYHAYSSSVTLKEVLSTSYYSLLLSKDEDDKSRFEILKKLNYLPEDQDAVIAEYLNNGYVDFSAAKELLTKKNEEYRLTNINESHRQIWRKYHSNFNTPQKEFIELQERFLKEHINDLGVRDVAATVEFILELDPEVNLENLMNKSIDLFVSKVERVDRHDLHSLRMQPKIIEKIEEKLSAKTKDYTIKELFVALAGSNGWNPSDIKHLLSFSENDFYEWITKEDSADVVSLVEEFLKRFGHQNEDEKNVVERIKGALEKVKDRSPIDRCRVEYLIENRKTN